MNLFLILGNQLFDPKVFKQHKIDADKTIFFMREDQELASYYKFHKHKIIFFFAAMRTYRDELRDHGYTVHYEEFQKSSHKKIIGNFDSSLTEFIKKNKITKASTFEIEDKFFESRIQNVFKKIDVELKILQSPMFLTSRDQFKAYLKSSRRPFMKTFYEAQRKRLNILIDNNNKPVGGSWSFDTENRLALPKNKQTPPLPAYQSNPLIQDVAELVESEFASHPGHAQDIWLPVDRQQAKKWLVTFLKERLTDFGPYEDAIAPHSEFVYHSVLTPFLNCGLLTPAEVVKTTLAYAEKNKVPLASLEGFIRQIIGWREFIRGIYQNYSEAQETENFWKHTHKLSDLWYKGHPPSFKARLRPSHRTTHDCWKPHAPFRS
jgi:deoxyribodipyrimidine photolyase-related protein